MILYLIIIAVTSYLLGNFNFAIIVSAGLGDDVRLHGSHNAGLTNMLRVYGKKAAVFTLMGDAAKGVLATFLAKMIITVYGIRSYALLAMFVATFMVMLGHIYPVFFNFRGGKGVLTTAACLAVVNYKVFLCAIAVFVLTVLITRYVSLGSVLAATTAAITVPIFCKSDRFILTESIIMIFAAAVIIVKHSGNMRRIRKGTEDKLKL